MEETFDERLMEIMPDARRGHRYAETILRITMNSTTTMTTTQRAQLELLRTHFGGTGRLCGTDLLTGQYYETIDPRNSDDFFEAHLLGPGRRRKPTEVVARDTEGVLHEIASFFRPQVHPLDAAGQTSAISMAITGQQGLGPTPELVQIVDALARNGWPVVIERSFRICRWVLWTFLTRPLQLDHARNLAYRQYCVARDLGLLAPELIEMPLIDIDADTPHVPYQFFSGSFFGMLYHLNGSRLEPVDLNALPHTDPSSEQIHLRSFVDDENEQLLADLLGVWWDRYGERRVRAGGIIAAIEDEGLSINSLVPPGDHHRRAIELGCILKDLSERTLGRWRLHYRRSGHGTTFWLVEVQKEQEECR